MRNGRRKADDVATVVVSLAGIASGAAASYLILILSGWLRLPDWI